MSNPFEQYGSTYYDKDGLPVTPPQPRPVAQPTYGMHPMQAMHAMPQTPPKSWVVALLLAFFLGTLGVHNFYLGYTRRGVTQLVLTILGWVTSLILIGFVLLIVVGVWVFVDFVLILLRSGKMTHDSHGVPLS